MRFPKIISTTRTKKGNLLDIPQTVITIFGVVIVAFIVITILTQFSTNVKNNPSTDINNSQITTAMDNHITRINSSVDYGVLLIAILFTVAGFILAKFIPSDPTYLIISYLIMGVFLILSFVFSNIHGGMMENSTYLSYIEGTKFISFLLPKLPYISIIQMILFSIGLYSKDE